jgi:hypothetical protein
VLQLQKLDATPTHTSYNINNIMATTFDKTINDFYDEHCLTFNQDNKIWLSFQANISKSLSSIDIIDNIDECKATMQCFLKWSLDNGCTWSEYKNIVDSAADFNDFVLAYANESVEAMFVLQIEIEWPTNWFESRHDNELPYIIKDIKLKETAGQHPNHRGMKKKLMDLMPETPFEGEPMAVIREPNDMEKSLL